ncbi:hypothetical protein GCM10027089_10960 [Nocardia thraciensis]
MRTDTAALRHGAGAQISAIIHGRTRSGAYKSRVDLVELYGHLLAGSAGELVAAARLVADADRHAVGGPYE